MACRQHILKNNFGQVYEFSPSTDRLKDIYEDGMTSNPIKSDQNTDTPSVIIDPMPYSGPMSFPSFDFFAFPFAGQMFWGYGEFELLSNGYMNHKIIASLILLARKFIKRNK